MRKFLLVTPVLLALLLNSCSRKTFFKGVEEIPLPPEATVGKIDGRYEAQLEPAKKAITPELRKFANKPDEKILLPPAEADAARIFEFYAPKFAERDFMKNMGALIQGANYQVNFWRNKSQTIAVVDAGKDADGKAVKFLAAYFGVQTVI
jgi:hypothetical protein